MRHRRKESLRSWERFLTVYCVGLLVLELLDAFLEFVPGSRNRRVPPTNSLSSKISPPEVAFPFSSDIATEPVNFTWPFSV